MLENEGLVFRYVHSLMRRFPQYRSQQDDILQEMRYVLVYGMADFDPTRAKFSTWLQYKMRAAFQRWLQDQSTLCRCPRLRTGGVASLLIEPLEADIPGEPERQLDDLPETVRAAIDALPKREQHVVRRIGLDGATYREVARELGVAKSWVDVLWSRAKYALREALADAV